MNDKFVWSEVYRPHTLEELITTDSIRATVAGILETGNIPNLLLVGRSGIGKTTIARMLVEQMGADYIIINASLKGNIDTLRNEIQQFASTVSFSGGRKYVILDEFDHSNPQSMQPALRNFMDTYVQNCGFILTANYKNKIIPALVDRCSTIQFTIDKSEYPKLSMAFVRRCEQILAKEGIEYDRESLARFVISQTPNWRSTLNALQLYAMRVGKIDAGILSASLTTPTASLIPLLKEGKFPEVRKWVAEHIDNDISELYTDLYEALIPATSADTVPDLVVTLAKYQYQAAFVADQQVNLAACLVELMVNCKFV